MKKLFFLPLLILLLSVYEHILAQPMPELTAENVAKYTQLCRQNIYKDMKGMYRPKGKAFKYPFLVPGSQQYLDQLWDWDSWLSNVALRQILLENGTNNDRKEAIEYEQGCVLNFLEFGGWDGWIPTLITRDTKPRSEGMPRDIFEITCTNPCWPNMLHLLPKTMGAMPNGCAMGFTTCKLL